MAPWLYHVSYVAVFLNGIDPVKVFIRLEMTGGVLNVVELPRYDVYP